MEDRSGKGSPIKSLNRTATSGGRNSCRYGCVASTVFKGFPDLVKMLEGPPIRPFSKTIKHAICSEYCRCNTSAMPHKHFDHTGTAYAIAIYDNGAGPVTP